ncbi:hypothetical protein P170DRAFT_357549 [Aspergillus steynii IBT 23096]|uniref:Sld7 C-terminal domain-containing protein n=1 Tax=Aspergillus steynii IBT 23096 TaxID=1392250 RepID=A0A2I2G9E0_9EURO|nr:uncharacterized protein P170DRAFT_357549 [Aspergillus steynii IBT 23096]PLB49492.1 hypothetical protein P170DRAFT_357549 [Aspergillus steynii IBT 23096]
MNVWSGALVLDSESQLPGLQLIDRSSSWQSDFSRDCTLSFRCFVNPALIPLYARVGPSLELHTTDLQTSQWLKGKLLGGVWLEEEDLDKFQAVQCPVGFLVSIGSSAHAKASASTTTDLLVHGALSSSASFGRPPTPPGSSSPASREPAPSIIRQELRIYATPLSASLVSKAQCLPSPDQTGVLAGDGRSAEFLPDIRSPSPKRKRVATLFETVAQHHRQVRQKGGQAVSQLMAHSVSQSSQQPHTRRVKEESEETNGLALDRIASQRSRSLSVGTNLLAGKPLEPRAEHLRPSSNRSHAREFPSRRNTPNPFVESIAKEKRDSSPALLSFEGKRKPLSIPKNAEAIILDNKNTITRTILTCMRLYGYNRASSRFGASSKNAPETITSHREDRDSRLTTDGIPLPTSAPGTDEDEFKAMYHATYRASTFALRKYLKEPLPDGDQSKILPSLLDKGKAMNYIDEFLRLFCEEN